MNDDETGLLMTDARIGLQKVDAETDLRIIDAKKSALPAPAIDRAAAATTEVVLPSVVEYEALKQLKHTLEAAKRELEFEIETDKS
ncbi:unnamed protein product, partial [Mesorhabditis spiculigera]